MTRAVSIRFSHKESVKYSTSELKGGINKRLMKIDIV